MITLWGKPSKRSYWHLFKGGVSLCGEYTMDESLLRDKLPKDAPRPIRICQECYKQYERGGYK